MRILNLKVLFWIISGLVPLPTGTPDCVKIYFKGEQYDFVPVLQCQFRHPGIVTYSLPLFADIDHDGETEVVVALEHTPNGFAVVDPQRCEAEYIIDVGGDVFLKDGGPALGDVDRDGYVDIFIEVNTTVQRWEYNPASNAIEKIWQTSPGVSVADRSHLDIWDLNQDGNPELIPNMGRMIDAVSGYVYPGDLPLLNTEGKGLFAFTADADPGEAPEGEGNVELIYGTHIYRYHFMREEWVLVRALEDLAWGELANVSIADMDLDGDVDAVLSRWNEVGEALIWDLQTEALLGGGVFDHPGTYGSRINIANMDSDPHPEMVMTCVYKIFAMDDIVNSGRFGTVVWLDITSDESGHTQLTSFDFDGNGTYEIAYRDETSLRIFTGMGSGIPSGGYPSSPQILLNTGTEGVCESYTGMEYPTIGDIDNDHEAEILATCSGSLNIYESGSLPWGNASRVWNTQAFNVTNVNQDGTIPARVEENYTLYNNFLAQVNTNPVSDTLRLAIPDAVIEFRNVEQDCYGGIAMDINVCNCGAAPLPSGTPVALYRNDPTATTAVLLDTIQLPAPLEAGRCVDLPVSGGAVTGEQGSLFAVVNDHGQARLPYALQATESGGRFPLTGIDECDYTNNITDTLLQADREIVSYIDTVVCDGVSVEVTDFEYDSPGRYSRTLHSAKGCDSIIHFANRNTACCRDLSGGDRLFRRRDLVRGPIPEYHRNLPKKVYHRAGLRQPRASDVERAATPCYPGGRWYNLRRTIRTVIRFGGGCSPVVARYRVELYRLPRTICCSSHHYHLYRPQYRLPGRTPGRNSPGRSAGKSRG